MKRFEAKNYLVSLLILSFFVLSGCGRGTVGGGLWDNPGTAPTVTAVAPLPDAVGVAINTKSVTAAFSQAMDPTTLTTASFTLRCNGTQITGGGAVTYLAEGNVATLPLPAATNLPALATCTAKITTVARDETRVALTSDYTWVFTTSATADLARPRVTVTAPVTTIPSPTPGVPSNTAITVMFNEDMTPATIVMAGAFTVTGPGATPVAAAVPAVTYDVASKTATFHPAAALPAGTYTATIKGIGANPAKDLAGNALAGVTASPLAANDYVWSFTSTGTPDTSLPRVTVTVPATTTPGPTSGVPTTTGISAVFNEDMNATTITAAGAFTVTGPGGVPVLAAVPAVTYNVASKTATFHPVAALPAGTYTATIKGIGTKPAKDLAGNALAGNPALPLVANNYVWSFITSAVFPVDQLAVPLGSAARFAILSNSAITNIPTSAIVGDVGLSPGARSNIAGLTAPEVTLGAIYAADDAAPVPAMLIAAKTDAEIAFLNANAAVRGTPTPISGNINGLTLVPGLYESGSSIEISPGGILYLDAGGNANAVFIIRSATSITTSATSEVVLAGSANAANIYWTAGSSITLGTNSKMKGTMIAGTSISLLTGSRLDGRALVQGAAAGQVSLDQSTVVKP